MPFWCQKVSTEFRTNSSQTDLEDVAGDTSRSANGRSAAELPISRAMATADRADRRSSGSARKFVSIRGPASGSALAKRTRPRLPPRGRMVGIRVKLRAGGGNRAALSAETEAAGERYMTNSGAPGRVSSVHMQTA
uniref:hypothetical protein n=1 Tax=Streptomyces sp. SID8382 TaxID=2690362 RepID=UPI001E4EC3DD|nr:MULTISPECIES: hypothetical protein [unclassified Streptomyces]